MVDPDAVHALLDGVEETHCSRTGRLSGGRAGGVCRTAQHGGSAFTRPWAGGPPPSRPAEIDQRAGLHRAASLSPSSPSMLTITLVSQASAYCTTASVEKGVRA